MIDKKQKLKAEIIEVLLVTASAMKNNPEIITADLLNALCKCTQELDLL